MRYYRNHCSLINGNYMKMLTLVDPDLRNVLILDNRPEVVMDKRNVVKIKSWEGGQDQELIFSLKILKEKGAAEDVRSHF
jgi:CTD nuclear envelope phosphatase 1